MKDLDHEHYGEREEVEGNERVARFRLQGKSGTRNSNLAG